MILLREKSRKKGGIGKERKKGDYRSCTKMEESGTIESIGGEDGAEKGIWDESEISKAASGPDAGGSSGQMQDQQ